MTLMCREMEDGYPSEVVLRVRGDIVGVDLVVNCIACFQKFQFCETYKKLVVCVGRY